MQNYLLTLKNTYKLIIKIYDILQKFMTDIIKELEKKREQAKLGGGKKRVDAQHARGKLTARERIDIIIDDDTFEEYDMYV